MAPHITTEVDCESLFSQTGHLSHPNRARTIAETFERLSMSKHIDCLASIVAGKGRLQNFLKDGERNCEVMMMTVMM